MHDQNESSQPRESEKKRSLPDGCGYRIGILVFFGFVIWLASNLMQALGS